MLFQVSQGIALYPPKVCPIAAEGRAWQRVSQPKLPSEGIALYSGIAEIVSPVAVSWATHRGSVNGGFQTMVQGWCANTKSGTPPHKSTCVNWVDLSF